MTFALLMLGLIQASALFAARGLPHDGRFAVVSAFAYPYLVVKGRTLHMGPGAKIYNEQNFIIMPVAMRAPANVLLRLDAQGEVSGIWVLTPEEAARYQTPTFKAPGPKGAPLK